MTKLKVLSLYTGAGGLDYGFEAAGFDNALALELDHDSCETLRVSRPSWSVIERDIFETESAEIAEIAEVERGDIDVLIGGPPCQPFSKSGYWSSGDSGRLNDPRAGTLGAYLRVLEDLMPRSFLLENVHGLAFSGKDEGLRYLLDQVAAINRRTGSHYRPSVRVLNAAQFGVPQVRERVFVVALRDQGEFEFPKPTHLDPLEGLDLGSSPCKAYSTAWDAIGDLSCPRDEDLTVKGKWADLLPSVPEGQNYLWHTDRGGGKPLFGWRRRYWSFLLKLAKARPSWTLQAQPGPAVGPFHWENRRLSKREMCRLQTFPDDVDVVGARTSVQRQIGNAVPSLLAEVLARQMRKYLLSGRDCADEVPILLPVVRTPIPPPEKVREVDQRYLALEGAHAAHPGTGRGFGALQRSVE